MTPLAPCEPQMAVAAASFNTLMSSISSVFTFNSCANFSSLAVAVSKSLRSTLHTLPFTTIRGSLLVSVETVEAPRSRIEVPAPRSPELATISRPAIRPCSASSTDVMPRPSNSFAEILCCEKLTSRSGIARPEVLIFFLALTSTVCSCLAFSDI